MSEKVCDWERPKIDDDDVPDIMDDYFRHVDKLKKQIKDLEADKDSYILLMDIKDKKIRELVKENEMLKMQMKVFREA